MSGDYLPLPDNTYEFHVTLYCCGARVSQRAEAKTVEAAVDGFAQYVKQNAGNHVCAGVYDHVDGGP